MIRESGLTIIELELELVERTVRNIKSGALTLCEDVVFGVCVVKEVTMQFEVWLIARRKRCKDGRAGDTWGVCFCSAAGQRRLSSG